MKVTVLRGSDPVHEGAPGTISRRDFLRFTGATAGLMLAGMAIRRTPPAAGGAALRAHADASVALRRYRRRGPRLNALRARNV